MKNVGQANGINVGLVRSVFAEKMQGIELITQTITASGKRRTRNITGSGKKTIPTTCAFTTRSGGRKTRTSFVERRSVGERTIPDMGTKDVSKKRRMAAISRPMNGRWFVSITIIAVWLVAKRSPSLPITLSPSLVVEATIYQTYSRYAKGVIPAREQEPQTTEPSRP